jgi:hypothetical protein
MKKQTKILKNKTLSRVKKIKSFVAVGDTIEVEYLGGFKQIVRVEKFEVIPNHQYLRPIDFVIHCKFSTDNGNGISSIECTSDNFKYIRHVKHLN